MPNILVKSNTENIENNSTVVDIFDLNQNYILLCQKMNIYRSRLKNLYKYYNQLCVRFLETSNKIKDLKQSIEEVEIEISSSIFEYPLISDRNLYPELDKNIKFNNLNYNKYCLGKEFFFNPSNSDIQLENKDISPQHYSKHKKTSPDFYLKHRSMMKKIWRQSTDDLINSIDSKHASNMSIRPNYTYPKTI